MKVKNKNNQKKSRHCGDYWAKYVDIVDPKSLYTPAGAGVLQLVGRVKSSSERSWYSTGFRREMSFPIGHPP